ncbi:MAG: peptidase T [Lachnospiraceae bacterium]|nr:peptidase T [Lachnospiraceae bacterium]
MESMLQRFIRYCSINTRSDESSTTVPTTRSQLDFVRMLAEDMEAIGLSEVNVYEKNGFVIGKLPANSENKLPVIGFIAHVDTADYEAEGIKPWVVENYDGNDILLNAEQGIITKVTDFPNLKNYIGKTLVVTDGTTLLGADDKAGVVEILQAMIHLVANPEIKHGDIWCAFGPDEEIGRGADNFDVNDFPADFAYTMDGAILGELEYESFNAAAANVTLHGVSVHPGSAKGLMINTAKLAFELDSMLPVDAVPEKTAGYEGFYMLHNMHTEIDTGSMHYIIRDHDRSKFEEKKTFFMDCVRRVNEKYGREVLTVDMYDQYYNMYDVIQNHMDCVEIAKAAMVAVGVKPLCRPIRGGTDGSKISFMGIPTPNIFVGAENLHGRHEFACLDDMQKAVDTIVEIVREK